ncbi:MAG: winged helix-turn-helix transcriptional regulator [Candidatus Thermoplasmatota archaeon]|nr:winged helix-turn-helix transcriptional regulator [Candidatus Thermoplasmatota archaeon]MCL5437569.1 winged helix-turn-helix transcriptional regulator [Candidatus Thermoplasmatota archaeon]
MLSAFNVLTSRSKLELVEILRNPRAPNDLAGMLGITRQAVDKHVKELVKFGVVEKRWFIGYSRPRVEFCLTELGKKLYSEIGVMMRNFVKDGLETMEEKKKALDIRLVSGNVSPEDYSRQMKEVEASFEWFTKMGFPEH